MNISNLFFIDKYRWQRSEIAELCTAKFKELIETETCETACKTQAGRNFFYTISQMINTNPENALMYTIGILEIAQKWPDVAARIMTNAVWTTTADALECESCPQEAETWN